ncbi:MAG: SGNH/GDSL hydrolase family protein [Chloroflexi bacterium]|nr:SGNH/GDSL hydrolase family protein [Chloroflexota bacterium]
MSMDPFLQKVTAFVVPVSLITLLVLLVFDRIFMDRINRIRVKHIRVPAAVIEKVLLVFIFFIVLEIGLRIYAGDKIYDLSENYTYDPALLWRWKPNLKETRKGLDEKESNSWTIETNSQGLREDDLPLEKSPGTYRIVFTGDSWTFGFGVDKGERFSSLAGEKLNELYPGMKIETINTGAIGYCFNQSLNILKNTGLKYHPDLVVSVKNRNESIESLFYSRSNNPGAVRLRKLLSGSMLYMFIWRQQNSDLFSRPGKKKGDDVQEYERKDIRELVDLCCSKNIKVLLVMLDWDRHGNPQQEVAEEKKVPYAEIVIPDREKYSFFRDPDHPNEEGHELIAEKTVKAIVEYKFLYREK